jgi:tRNA nucleotidyltransferase (CCA-adding enzyme)
MQIAPPGEVYLVGGAVRDQLLKLPVKDRDWVVVGATPSQMLARGYRQVGKDFPVFLHPQSGEEYALARTERKTGPGYHGFHCNSQPHITLEDDLRRRDLTINAMAMDAHHQLHDPFGGAKDIQRRLLRHVSPAFSEDPLRILRIARFKARLAPLGFCIAAPTWQLMSAMIAQQALTELAPERVWQETERALGEACPSAYLDTLDRCGALEQLIPRLGHLQADELKAAGELLDRIPPSLPGCARLRFIRFCYYCYAIANTGRNPETLQATLHTWKAPRKFSEPTLLFCGWFKRYLTLNCRDMTALLQFLEQTDSLRRPDRLSIFLATAEQVARHQQFNLPFDGKRLEQAVAAIKTVDSEPLRRKGIKGQALGAAIRQQRKARLARELDSQ